MTNPTRLPDPPREYDPAYMRALIKQLELFILSSQATGRVTGTTANLSKLPTSAVGLATGELWNSSGTVKIV